MRFHFAGTTGLASVACSMLLLPTKASATASNMNGLRRAAEIEPAPRRRPQAAGDMISTTIDLSPESKVLPELVQTESGATRAVYEIMFRAGASFTTVHFANFDFAEGCTMQVSGKDLNKKEEGTPRYDYESTEPAQAYKMSHQGKHNAGTFWTQHVKGDTMYLDIRCTGATELSTGATFSIDQVSVGFVEGTEQSQPDNIFGDGESICGTSDFQNVKCYGSIQYARARAVARLLISTNDGSFYCTGFLASATNHLITNEHCISNAQEALNTDYEFGAEASSCGTSNCQGCHRGPTSDMVSGATFIRDSTALDYGLVQITSANPQATYGFLEFDNRVGIVNENIYIPQHPSGRAKEFGIVSTHNNDVGLCRMNSITEVGCTGGPGDYGYYCDTQGGSSGSPVLASSSNKVIALHHCRGTNACTQSGGDENRGVPIRLINAEIGSILASPVTTPAPSPPVPAPTPAPTFACPAGQSLFTLDLQNDFYGGETTWQVTNTGNGATLLSGGPYQQDQLVFANTCLAAGTCYTFTIFDRFGDGICCAFGTGSWEITFGGATVGSGGVFGISESDTFGSNCPGAPTPTPPTASPPGGGDDDSGGGDGGGLICFSEDVLVDVQHMGPVPMKDVQVGDHIRTSPTEYQPVYSFAHYHRTRKGKFLVLHTSNHNITNQHPLEISQDHLIYLHGKRTPVRAKTLTVGDKLAPAGANIISISSVEKNGLYAPITPDGSFLIFQPGWEVLGTNSTGNGMVKVSSYAAIVQHQTQSAYVLLDDGTSLPISQHRGIHMVLTPFRLFCTSDFASGDICNSYDEQGLPHYISWGIDILGQANQQPKVLQLIMFVLAIIVFGSLVVVEQILQFGFLVTNVTGGMAGCVLALTVVAYTKKRKIEGFYHKKQ